MSWDIPPLEPLYKPADGDPLWYKREEVGGIPIYRARDGKPMTLQEWLTGSKMIEYRVLGQTQVGDDLVITVWTGIETDGAGLIYGTAVMRNGSSPFDEVLTDSEQAARAEHDRRVAALRAQQAMSQRR